MVPGRNLGPGFGGPVALTLILIGTAGLGLVLVLDPETPATVATAQPPVCTASETSLTPAGWMVATLPAPHLGSFAPTIRDVPLPGPTNRFDYQSLDVATGRLFVSHMDAGSLVVFDVRAERVIAEVKGLPRATGVWAVPEHNAVWVSAAGQRAAARVDGRNFQVTARVGGIRFPDGITFVPEENKVFVSDEAGDADVVIDAITNAKRSTIPLGGEAGNTHYDSVSHCVLVAVQTRNQLVAIDPATERVVHRYDLTGAEHPHGFTLDEAGRLAFITGQANGSLIVLDLRTMRVLASHAVARSPDVLAWDPEWRWLYVASESGVVSVFSVDRALREVGELRAPHAHSVSVDPGTHRVYLPLEDIDGKPVLRIVTP